MEQQHAFARPESRFSAPSWRANWSKWIGALFAPVVVSIFWAGDAKLAGADQPPVGSTPASARNGIAGAELRSASTGVRRRGSDGFRLNIRQTSVPPYGQMIAVDWDGAAGATSQLQVSSNLITWEDIGAAITNTGPAESWQEYISSLPAYAWPFRFYRVKQTSPVAGLPSRLLDLTEWKLTLPVNTVHLHLQRERFGLLLQSRLLHAVQHQQG